MRYHIQKGSCLCAKWSCAVEPLCTQLLFTLLGRACASSWGEHIPVPLRPPDVSPCVYIVLDQQTSSCLLKKHSAPAVGWPRKHSITMLSLFDSAFYSHCLSGREHINVQRALMVQANTACVRFEHKMLR